MSGCLPNFLGFKKVKYKSMQERSNISLCKISVPYSFLKDYLVQILGYSALFLEISDRNWHGPGVIKLWCRQRILVTKIFYTSI